MNFDDYERHIIQKYRLVVAISVLKTKPEETSLGGHITDLKNKFDDKMDLDITICSDDFNLDDDTDFDIINNQSNDITEYNDAQVNDFNDNSNRTFPKDYDAVTEANCDKYNAKENEFSDVIHIFKNIEREIENKPPHNQTCTQTTYCESLQHTDSTLTPESFEITHDKYLYENVDKENDKKVCNNYDKCPNEIPYERLLAVNKVLNVVEREDSINASNNVRSNEMELTQNNQLVNTEFRLDNNLTFYDSQATEIYTLHGFTQNCTHVSQSQNSNFDIPRKFITGIPKKIDKFIEFRDMEESGDNTIRQNCNNNMSQSLLEDFKNRDCDKNVKNSKVDINNEKIRNSNIAILETLNTTKDNNKNNEDVAMNVINNPPSQFSQANTFITGHNQTDNNTNTAKFEKISIEKDFTRDFCENAQRDYYSDDYLNIHAANPETNTSRNFETEKIDNNNITNITVVKKSIECDQNRFLFDPPSNVVVENDNNHQDTNTGELEEESDVPCDISEEELTIHVELVPFKVVEELNKVRTFLNRRERRMSCDGSSDSGYKSDSQGRSLKNSLQLSCSWVNQSAHCLYEYIAGCSLVSSAQDMADDISQVLGELIDKLHEEEIYPIFLEELFDYHKSLIQDIYNTGSTLIEKDESIQRFLLVNKSVHILKYSIEKLTDLLEDIHKKLTDEETMYELTNIVELENTAYIFHVLEIIMKRYLKSKNIIENTQLSQNSDKIIKKSTITDIWRRKWNPNYKDEIKIVGALEKKCVFTKCNEVLNKIVVECMNGYSLVAFAALQCFNLLQT